MDKNLLSLFILLWFHSLGVSQNIYTYSEPQPLDDGWSTGSLPSEGIDSTLFHKFFNDFIVADHKIHSFLLIRNKKLILEEYFADETVETRHDLRSVTKSITSLLLGIAIEKGFVESIEDPLLKYIKSPKPSKNGDSKDGITIKNLITMSSGLDCNDWDKNSKGQEDKVYKKSNWLQYILDLPMKNSPGDTSLYCSVGVILTAEVIEQSSGMSIMAFADKYLFSPLGIENVAWQHTNSKEVISSGKRLHMTSRDLAKIGQVVLDKGLWNDEPVVSEEWIALSTSSHTKIGNLDYGFLWWQIPFRANGTKKAIVATGNGGQYIMVFPEKDLIAIFTGGAYNSADDKLPFIIVDKVVLPSIQTAY